MTDNTSDLLPLGTVEAIGKAAAFNQSNTVLHDPRPHSQRLGDGMFKAAANYANTYKQHHPEAANQITRIAAFAFKPKPAGYTEYMDRLIGRWLSGADTETNTATVKRIRDRFPNHSFAGSLLNKDISKGRLQKIAANAAEQGFHIDTRKYDTLSKIKAAALKGELGTVAGRHININATITDTHVAGLKIELHGKRQSVRFTHGDKRTRIYIDDLIALSEWLAVEGGAATGEGSTNILLCSIETLAQETRKPAETRQQAPEIDALCSDAGLNREPISGILAQETRNPAETLDSNGEIVSGNIGPNEMAALSEPTLIDRTAALRAHLTPVDAPTYPPDYDPLCDL